VGEAAYVNTDEKFCMGQDVCMIRSRTQDQRYLVHQLRSPVVMTQLDQMMVGATFKRINVEDVKGLLVACPPVAEQRSIAAHIDHVCYGAGGVNGVIDASRRAIDRLNEYRQSLITAAVTGKIDVRQGATA
jgi:type I restriction enzyme, S subunit